jgi:8-oxo-dGTP diphosphatase
MEQPRHKQIEVVAGLIFDGQKLLVCQRHHTAAFPLKWEFPGGKVEAGESATSALARELKEELGIGTGELEFIQHHNHAYADGPDVALRFYRVVDYQGVIKNLVFEQIVWSKLAELSSFDFLDGDLPLVHQLVNGELSAQLLLLAKINRFVT